MRSILLALALIAAVRVLPAQTEFSQQNAENILRHLAVDIGPRPMGSPGEREALAFAAAKFREYGCDTSYVMPMSSSTRSNTTSGIAVGIKRGQTGRAILLGGHIDSAGPEIPGADDDGSGSATVMELARVLAGRTHHSTLVFCCFGGEEQGLEGSTYFAGHYQDLDSVDLMLQADMANGTGVIDMDPDVHGASAPAWLVRAAAEEFYKLGYDHLRYPTHAFSLNYARTSGAGSDHEPFLDRGIPAIDFSTDVGKPIHTPRDNWENFDPAGLKRTGDLFVRLVDRFDGGRPGREVDRYWLYLLAGIPLFIPIWGVWAFAGLSVLLAIAAYAAVRARTRAAAGEAAPAPRVKLSGLKIFVCSLIIVAFGWLSSDLISLLKGVRHPWLTSIGSYYLFGTLASLVGGLISWRLARRMKISANPAALFFRGALMLVILTAALGFVGVKLSVEPAVGLALISLALLVRTPVLKIFFLALSPWWLLRLVFSEWDAIFFHTIGSALPAGPGAWFAFNGGAILVLSILIVPFLYALGAVFRDAPSLERTFSLAGSWRMLVASLLVLAAFAAVLWVQPTYDSFWQRDLRIEESYDMDAHTQELFIRSGEYLSGVSVHHAGTDTLISGRTTVAKIPGGTDFDTTWAALSRTEERTGSGETSTINVGLVLSTKMRPYTVTLSYTGTNGAARSVRSPLKLQTDTSGTRIRWYSFPDSIPTVPVQLTLAGSDSVTENLEVTFAALASPMTVTGESSYLIPRTIYRTSHVYRR